jgi:sugar phosphate isomerase/epimerase
MQFGICTKVERAGELKAAGADFVEENVQTLLQGLIDDSEWRGLDRVTGSPLPILAANSLVPGDLKIVGEKVDFDRLQKYISNVVRRAKKTGMKILVFGSGGARNVPEGFSRQSAREQITDFCKMAAEICASNGVTLVAEPLNKGECNIINTVAEAMEYVKAVNHPNFQCLVDSYHFWLENEPLENLTAAMPWIKHVHVADKDGRVAAGESSKSDYRPFFRVLKRANYRGLISIEALNFNDFETVGKRSIAFLRKQWEEA